MHLAKYLTYCGYLHFQIKLIVATMLLLIIIFIAASYIVLSSHSIKSS